MITAELKGATIRVRFPYDKGTILLIHQILDAQWNKAGKFWYMPASPWHAEQVFKFFPQVVADKWVIHLARTMPYFRILSHAKTHANPQGGLYPYQMAGVEYVEASNGHAMIADSTGTGKTVVALHWARTKGEEIRTMLVVCPSSVKYKWADEIRKWYDPSASPIIVDSPYVPLGASILIMSYDRMRTLKARLLETDYDLMILDEIQAVKNPKSQRGAAARKISAKSKYVLGISATPSPNRPMELFNELHILRPWEYPSSWTFGGRYAGGPYEYSAFKGSSHTEELRDRLTSIMIRRKKADVLEQLPQLTRSVMWTDLPTEDLSFYQQVEYEAKQAIRSMNPKHKGYFAGVLDKITGLREAVGIAKAGLAAEFINSFLEEGESKIVVSCYFMKTIETIQDKLNEFAIVMTGQTSDKAREEAKDLFRYPGGPRVLLMSSVGSEGIDLFGMNGVDISNILLVDRQWTPAAEEQAEGRLHRIGQLSAVTSHYLNANRTIDKYMVRVIDYKRKVGEETANQGEVVNLIIRGLLEDDNNN